MQWTGRARAPPARRRHGGCDFAEDPALDARDADPAWLPDPDALIGIGPAVRDDDDAFSLWSIPGRKSIVHDGKRLLVRSRLGRQLVRLAVSLTLSEGAPYAFAVPPGRDRRSQGARQATERLIDVLHGVEPPRRGTALTRGQVVHMRALHALDAERAGLSEREIGEAVLGDVPVGEKWNDSAERAQVRYLLRHGRRHRDGGYRQLLRTSSDQASPESGREEADSRR